MSWKIASQKFMSENFTISLQNLKCGRVHTLITNAFSHIDTWHIANNMLEVYFFGTAIGRIFGPEYLLKLYLTGAVVGSVFFLAHEAYKGWRGMEVSEHPAWGANGAANAITLTYIFLFPRSTIWFDFILPVPAFLVGTYFIGRDLWRMIQGDDRVMGSVQLAGVVVAAIARGRIRKARF